MKNLYRKNELVFALVWIAIYVAGTSLAEALSEMTGVFKLFPAVFHVGMTVLILSWLKKNGLFEKYGLFLPRYRIALAWFFLPLALVAAYKLFFSPALRYPADDALLFVVSMMCVGFLEEIIFRGFLFRAIEKDSLKQAIVISAVTFGIGHIVNLLNGQDLFDTAGQIIFAVIVGFALVILAYKGKSMVPGILFHGIFNSLSIFSNEEAQFGALGGKVPAAVILIAGSALILGGFSVWNWKHLEG